MRLRQGEPAIPPQPLSPKGRVLVGIIVLLFFSMWGAGVYEFVRLPATIPHHFDFQGHPTTYGGKTVIWVLTAALSIVPLIFVALIRWRFTLVNRYAYFLSLPAFFLELKSLHREQQGHWINRYFELVAGFGVMLSLLMFGVEIVVFVGMEQQYTWPGLSIGIMVFALVLLGWFFLRLRRLEAELRSVISQSIES